MTAWNQAVPNLQPQIYYTMMWTSAFIGVPMEMELLVTAVNPPSLIPMVLAVFFGIMTF